MKENDGLGACPFCPDGGSPVVILLFDGSKAAVCKRCGAVGPSFGVMKYAQIGRGEREAEESATKAWNTRSRPEAVKRLVEAAKEALELMLTGSTCFGLGVCKYYTECVCPDGECQFVIRLTAALAAVEG